MNLLHYVNEEIDESRGMEYLRKCSSRDVFHSVLGHVWKGVEKAKQIHPQGELTTDMAFELVHTFPNSRRIVRVKMVAAPPACKKFKQQHHSTFLIKLCQQGQVIGVYKDALSLNG